MANLKGIVDPTKLQTEPAKRAGPAFACGHPVPFDMNCPSCRAEKTRAKKADRPQPPDLSRLPVGSRKHIDWDGKEWTGVMLVPGCPEFRKTASGEKACCHGLDAEYRAYLQAHETTKTPASA